MSQPILLQMQQLPSLSTLDIGTGLNGLGPAPEARHGQDSAHPAECSPLQLW